MNSEICTCSRSQSARVEAGRRQAGTELCSPQGVVGSPQSVMDLDTQASPGPWAWFLSLDVERQQQVLALDRPLAHLLVHLLDKAAEAGQRVALFEWAFIEHSHCAVARSISSCSSTSTKARRSSTSSAAATTVGEETQEAADEDSDMDASVTAGLAILDQARCCFVDRGGCEPTHWDTVTLDRDWLATPSQLLVRAQALTDGRFLGAPPRVAPASDKGVRSRCVPWLADVELVHAGALLLGGLEAGLWNAYARDSVRTSSSVSSSTSASSSSSSSAIVRAVQERACTCSPRRHAHACAHHGAARMHMLTTTPHPPPHRSVMSPLSAL